MNDSTKNLLVGISTDKDKSFLKHVYLFTYFSPFEHLAIKKLLEGQKGSEDSLPKEDDKWKFSLLKSDEKIKEFDRFTFDTEFLITYLEHTIMLKSSDNFMQRIFENASEKKKKIGIKIDTKDYTITIPEKEGKEYEFKIENAGITFFPFQIVSIKIELRPININKNVDAKEHISMVVNGLNTFVELLGKEAWENVKGYLEEQKVREIGWYGDVKEIEKIRETRILNMYGITLTNTLVPDNKSELYIKPKDVNYPKQLLGVARCSVLWKEYNYELVKKYLEENDIARLEREVILIEHETALIYNPKINGVNNGFNGYANSIIWVIEAFKSAEAFYDLFLIILNEEILNEETKKSLDYELYSNRSKHLWSIYKSCKSISPLLHSAHIQAFDFLIWHIYEKFRLNKSVELIDSTLKDIQNITNILGFSAQIDTLKINRWLLIVTIILLIFTIILLIETL